MDILQSIPHEDWNVLKDSLKRDWPAYAYYHNYLKNSIKWMTMDPSLKIEFYCPNGKTDAGVFISKSNHGIKIFLVFSFEESKDLLLKVLHETDRIDWSDTFNFACIHENIRDVFMQFLDESARSKGLRTYTYFDNYSYLESKENCLKMDLQVPEECELRRIDETYVSLMHSIYPHRDEKRPEETLEFLRTIAKLNGGYGLFMKKDNSLVSWILQCNLGGLGILQTFDEHKRKGYGKTVTQALMKYLAEKQNLDVTSFVIQANKPSQKLFESLGFKRVASSVWILINH